jgi:hypothetical protein
MYALASAEDVVSGALEDRHSGVSATDYRDVPTECSMRERESGVFVRISVGIYWLLFRFCFCHR